MENEEKNFQAQPEKSAQKEIKVSFSERILNSSFAIVALVMVALCKVIGYFVLSPILVGIFAIIIYSFAIIGVLWNYAKFKKPTVEFFFSAGVAFLALLVI